MKVAIAADHAGSLLLTPVLDEVRRLGHEALDLGTHDAVTPDDYPDRAADLAAALADGRADRGILVCGSGVGASVAANKVRGIRAALCHDTYSAHQGVEHDQMNVLCLGARVKRWRRNWCGPFWQHGLATSHGIGGGWRRSLPWKQSSAELKHRGDEQWPVIL
jgi:ribose 5-phosphate isomerase B